MKYNVRLEPIGISMQVNAGTPLVDIVHEYGIEFPCGGRGICGRCKVKLLKGNIEISRFHQQALDKNELSGEWRLACFSEVNDNIIIEIDQWETIILADNTRFDFIPRKGFGIAVDLGTTTLVSQLLDLSTGNILSVQTSLNPQVRNGADIMSRIEFALRNTENRDLLKHLIREAIGQQIIELLKNHPVNIDDIIIVGNTVMHHLFSGIDVKPLAGYPFEPIDKSLKKFSADELGWNLNQDVRIKFMPSIGSFVGSDILAGILASRLYKSEKYQALIDLGTNGEIVIGNRERIVCASTAAGPAFEGTNISLGMRAVSGAISTVKEISGKIECHVIGNEKPRGICGSGLIDAIAVFTKNGQIDSGGQIVSEEEKIMLAKPVYISQRDVREFQLAKAAIAAGLQILMHHLGITHNDIEKIYIAGGFGNYIDLKNTIQINMLEFPFEKISKLSNSALIGAKMLLFEDEKVIDEILNISKHISLESNPDFQNIFCDKMFF